MEDEVGAASCRIPEGRQERGRCVACMTTSRRVASDVVSCPRATRREGRGNERRARTCTHPHSHPHPASGGEGDAMRGEGAAKGDTTRGMRRGKCDGGSTSSGAREETWAAATSWLLRYLSRLQAEGDPHVPVREGNQSANENEKRHNR